MTLRFAYNTNGTANHRIEDAIRLIKDAGYDGVALTLDIHHLDPFAENWVVEADRIASLYAAMRGASWMSLRLASPSLTGSDCVPMPRPSTASGAE